MLIVRAFRLHVTFIGVLVMAPLAAWSARAAAQTGTMRVSLPSPTAASIGKFGEVPVSLATGTPEIAIPIFTMRGRTLEPPISLRYHASGVRVEEIGGWAGIGWTLDAGGAITRTVRGLVDETTNGYYWTGHFNWPRTSRSGTIRNGSTRHSASAVRSSTKPKCSY